MKLSVLVAVYNNAPTILRTIDSVYAQTYDAKELIIMDGGSTDGTVEILAENSEKITYWESQADGGIYHAWNKALTRATGDWVCFLGADDFLWQPDVMARLRPELEAAFPRYRVVYGKATVVKKDGEVIKVIGTPWASAKKSFSDHLSIPHPGLLHHTSLFAEHGHFDDSFKLAGDYDLLLRELTTRDALFLPEIVTVGVQHGGVSNTPSAMQRYLAENERVYQKHNIKRPGGWGSSRTYFNMLLASKLSLLIGDRGVRKLSDFARRLRGKPEIWNDQ